MLQVQAIPAFNDNYIWLIVYQRDAWVVDPGDAEPVLAALAKQALQLRGVLLTHHHGDHSGGIAQLKAQWPELIVCGNPDSPAAALVTKAVTDGDSLNIGGQRFNVLAVPGHTLDHLAFHCPDQDLLFCGDTLFVAGCGRVFEGSLQQMYDSLQRLAALPASTRVYCAHEYTLSNLRFAQAVSPACPAVSKALIQAEQQRAQGLATVPGTIGNEKQTNPFLTASDFEQFCQRREWKNHF